MQVEVIGPSIVGGYYGADNPVAVRKGDYGRLVVQAMHTLFPGNTADPKWNTIHSYSYHAYNKGGVKMLYDATRLSDAMKVCHIPGKASSRYRPGGIVGVVFEIGT